MWNLLPMVRVDAELLFRG